MVKTTKKGYALAYVVVVMVAVLAICTLIAYLTISFNTVARLDLSFNERREFLDRLGYAYTAANGEEQLFYSRLTAGEEFDYDEEAATVRWHDAAFKIDCLSAAQRVLTVTLNGNTVLNVTLKSDGASWKVSVWQRA